MHDVDGVNAGYARLLLEQYLDDPESVSPEWRALFERGDTELVRSLPGLARLLERAGDGHGNGRALPAAPPAAPSTAADAELLGAVAAAMALVKAHRTHGHLAARLDPLGSAPIGDPSLDPSRLQPKLTPELQRRVPAAALRVHVEGETLAEALPRLRETYCGTMAYEIEHIAEHDQRVWLRQAIESWRFRTPLAPEEQRRLYVRLCEVEGLERYLRRAFLGQKQFSIEGVDVLIPMLDEALELAAAGGARDVVIGMAHRGRLNVLAHTIGLPYEKILREFEGERTLDAVAADAEGGTGDVKYHLGAHGVRDTAAGKLAVTLAANPSHLEAVDPVVEGMTRALQTDRSAGAGIHDPSVAMPILLHGDAAFAGQGVVAETLNLYALEGYSTGGTLHIITDNQVGFTTDPSEERSTRHSSDLAKGFDTPIVHVNADDPEAAISAVRLASEAEARVRQAHERLKRSFGDAAPDAPREEPVPRERAREVVTRVAAGELRRLTAELARVPDGFTVHPKLARQLERRPVALEEGGIDWGHAEALAFASLLVDGIPIRLTGQDTERGTFSQRHLVLHDAKTGELYTPMQAIDGAQASFEVYNSPLSEYACVGFEYGYSTMAPEALVLWEAQFGDFANGAQTIIDQFISSGLAKWGQTTRLTLLLPHGYEGNGPEHSSARLERFLQLSAQENLRIANCTTAAQYFHLLRRQALDPSPRPLVVMTPKGLLRLKEASSTLADLAEGSFRPLLDADVEDRASIRRLVLCSGKVYYDIVGHEQARSATGVAVARIEQLYPFPVDGARELIAGYPRLDEIVWAQEEPQNMGAWRTIRHRLEEAAAGIPVRYVGRPWRASTAEGYPTTHVLEQDRIARAVLTL